MAAKRSGKADLKPPKQEGSSPALIEEFAKYGAKADALLSAHQRITSAVNALIAEIKDSKAFNEDERDALFQQVRLSLPVELTPRHYRFAQRELPEEPPVPWESFRYAQDEGFAPKLNPVEFIRMSYKEWIGKGLTRHHLRQIDPHLYQALNVWEHRHPEQRMTDLPTKVQVIDEKIAALSAEMSPDELRKLASTLQARHRRMKS